MSPLYIIFSLSFVTLLKTTIIRWLQEALNRALHIDSCPTPTCSPNSSSRELNTMQMWSWHGFKLWKPSIPMLYGRYWNLADIPFETSILHSPGVFLPDSSALVFLSMITLLCSLLPPGLCICLSSACNILLPPLPVQSPLKFPLGFPDVPNPQCPLVWPRLLGHILSQN